MASLHPYSTLTPDRVLDAIDSIGLRTDGRLLALNSYENRVYQIGVGDGEFVVAKFYRPARWSDAAILEEHAFVAELSAQEIPVVAALSVTAPRAGHQASRDDTAEESASATLHRHAGFRFAVYPRHGGRMPEFERHDTLQWMGRFLGRIHAVGARANFSARPTLDLASFGFASRDFLARGDWLPADLRAAWDSVVEQALDGVRYSFERAGTTRQIRLHGDCHAGNVLWTDDGPHFVDFDDSRMGPAMQDLWMLLSGDREAMQRQLREVLSGYEAFHDFDPRELHLLEALRTLRLIHHAAWLARRWQDPAFPAAFPWFNTQHYWQERILELREQIALMEEAPLVP